MFSLEKIVTLIAIASAFLSLLAWVRKAERDRLTKERDYAHLLRNYDSLSLSYKNLDESLADIHLELVQLKMLMSLGQNPPEVKMTTRGQRRQ
jgi:uncharacterized membrane protein